MSTLESIIWYTLGYMAMPVIFISGFIVTALIACFLIERMHPEN